MQDMKKTDRWELHSAVELEVTLPWANNVTIRLKQEPHALNATRMGVGACLWEGEIFLAAYLSSLPLHRYIGARVIELGSGPGLIGLMLSKLGAKVRSPCSSGFARRNELPQSRYTSIQMPLIGLGLFTPPMILTPNKGHHHGH